ncbi:hypothetical protein ACFQJC_08035 [Haloferax namakaokahaiae]|uniref:Uncharacterized protein n=1 Tax=Haloferax namakaokahaiae TaxID=1748331 RepID=A0ABD5ZE30_9EURY
MPTTHLAVLGLEIQRVVTPLEDGRVTADRACVVRDVADPELGHDPAASTPGRPRVHAHAAQQVIDALSTHVGASDEHPDEARLPFNGSFADLYAETTALLRETAADGPVTVNLAAAPPQVGAAFYAARTALVEQGVVSRDDISLWTIPATEHRDLAAIDVLRTLVTNAEDALDTLSSFETTANGPVAEAVAEPVRIALDDLQLALDEATGTSSSGTRRRSVRRQSSNGSALGSMSSYLDRARDQLSTLVEADEPTPDPENTRDPYALLDAFDDWLEAELGLLSQVEEEPTELVERFRESCEARFGKFEDDATVSLFASLDRFEAHLESYLQAREQLGAAHESVASATTTLASGVEEATDRLTALDSDGATVGTTVQPLDAHSLAPLSDLEATVLHVLSTSPPRSRQRTRRALAALLRERAEHHGIVAGARDEDERSAFEAFCVTIARDSDAGDEFETRLADDLRARFDVAVEGLFAHGFVQTRERETGRDALELAPAGHLWTETSDEELLRETAIDDLLRDCVERADD